MQAVKVYLVSLFFSALLICASAPSWANRYQTDRPPVFSIELIEKSQPAVQTQEGVVVLDIQHNAYEAIILTPASVQGQISVEMLCNGLTQLSGKLFQAQPTADWKPVTITPPEGKAAPSISSWYWQPCQGSFQGRPIAILNNCFRVSGQPFMAMYLTSPEMADSLTELMVNQLFSIQMGRGSAQSPSSSGIGGTMFAPRTRGQEGFKPIPIAEVRGVDKAFEQSEKSP